MRLIDADKLCDAIHKCINEASTVDPVNHAYWSTPKFDYYVCSECGYKVCAPSPLLYCPGCGSKMDAEHESETPEDKRVRCPWCGTVVRFPEEANFCERCRKKLKQVCNCWVKKEPYNCGFEECPGYKLFLLEKELQVHNQS